MSDVKILRWSEMYVDVRETSTYIGNRGGLGWGHRLGSHHPNTRLYSRIRLELIGLLSRNLLNNLIRNLMAGDAEKSLDLMNYGAGLSLKYWIVLLGQVSFLIIGIVMGDQLVG